jgi:hypothetical protein
MSIGEVPKCRWLEVQKCRGFKVSKVQDPKMSIFIWVIQSKGMHGTYPRDHDFATQRFEHGAQCEFAKREIVMHLRVGPMITAHGHMESSFIKKGKAPIEQWATKIIQGNDLVVKIKENPTINLDGSFRGIEHQDI